MAYFPSPLSPHRHLSVIPSFPKDFDPACHVRHRSLSRELKFPKFLGAPFTPFTQLACRSPVVPILPREYISKGAIHKRLLEKLGFHCQCNVTLAQLIHCWLLANHPPSPQPISADVIYVLDRKFRGCWKISLAAKLPAE